MNADTAEDEAQDLKRAKITAADLRDFLNQFPEVSQMENGREYVWGKMIDANVLPDTQFLELMKNIFDASPLFREGETATPEATAAMAKAKAVVQKIIRMIQEELDEYEKAMKDWEMGQEDESEEGEDSGDLYAQLGISKPGAESKPKNELEKLQAELDQAIDDEDYVKAAKLRDQIESLKR
ncbi:MAG: hypothetical protein DVB29_05770 [Verrucomicrobia bacterium]|nr:MAG: hypothetical protein DVB29_05770 [Verrucomicrobiota bacterium]